MSGTSSRWYHLIVLAGAILALVQSIGGVVVSQHARASSPMLTKGQAEVLFNQLRRADHVEYEAADVQVMDQLIARFHDDGLRGVAVYDSCGELLSHSTHQVPAFNPAYRGRLVDRGGGVMLYVMPPPRHEEEPCEEFEEPDGPLVFMMTMEATMASALTRRGQAVLAISMLSALLTLFGSIALWRLLLRDLRVREDAAKDRYLASLGEMSAIVAHELRNPLTSAKGNTQMLVEFRDQDEAWKLKKLDLVVQDLLTIEYRTDNLLRFVRSGTVHAQSVTQALLLECLETISRRTDTDRLSVETTNLPSTMSLDLHVLEDILSNLVSNALDASDAQVFLRVHSKGKKLHFEVRDYGPGLPEGVDVFEPFVTTKTRGTGLGLPVARRLVEAHGGQLQARRLDDGSVFFFDLPLSS